jgi:hypothetical protein
MQLAASALPAPSGGSVFRYLALQQSTPPAVVLVEADEQPLCLHWLRRAAKLWHSMPEMPPHLVCCTRH